MKKILLTTVATAILATSSAYATEGDFYVKGEGNWTVLDKVKESQSGAKLKSKSAGSFGIGAGLFVMDNVRTDLTFTHFINPQHKGSSSKLHEEIKAFTPPASKPALPAPLPTTPAPTAADLAAYDANVTAAIKAAADLDASLTIKPQPEQTIKGDFKIKGEVNTLMLNAFVDVFDITEGAKIFVGAGVGLSQLKAKATFTNRTSLETGKDAAKDTVKLPDISYKAKQKYSAAFAGYVGVSYEFAPSMAAELTYSYKDLGKTNKFINNEDAKDTFSGVHYKGHNVGLGIRFGL